MKYQDAGGNKFVRVTLLNTVGGRYETDTLADLIDADGPLGAEDLERLAQDLAGAVAAAFFINGGFL